LVNAYSNFFFDLTVVGATKVSVMDIETNCRQFFNELVHLTKKTDLTVEGYGGSTAYSSNVKEAARRETCAETFYDAF
jgi:hypothetical protein